MTPDKHKAQKREYMKAKRAEKKARGYVNFVHQILPEWREKIMEVIRQLERGPK